MTGAATLGSVAAGGALGAVLRYAVSTAVYGVLGRGFPWGTLVVNLLGSLAMGLLWVLLVERLASGPALRAFLTVGLLGAFTTFSTFAIETLSLAEEGAWLAAAANVVASVVLCLAAAAVGVWLGRSL
ncbi:fluoride efflux transporter CrcB [Inmirania thermothiophila]|uniref:Fluoride-specific ion channel FluC n=1 Tax=Inmirania thermothiophila TaxID=1750597 RepID=A0A3N1Y0U5_9GAMM|nr:fluoride efflux transporter CrcB [Inmirania thermothiophila]ROR32151.1 camphor resistance protein CrcB [Inmirania thermothiophila]